MTKLFEVEVIGKIAVLRPALQSAEDGDVQSGAPICAGSPREVGNALAAHLKTLLTPEAQA